MTMDQLMGSLQAYSERLLKKEETDSQVLKSNVSVEDKDKVLYTKYRRGRGCGRVNKNSHQGRGRGFVSNRFGEQVQANQQVWHGQGRSRGRGGRSAPGRGNRSNIESYNCGKFGHFSKDCWFNKRVEEKANIAQMEEQQNDGVLLMANKEIIQEDDVIWYLDSGVSNHMTGLKHLFTYLRDVNSGFVSFGDASKVEVKGKG
ncbi:uncharacterized protein LOC141660046 [Apium graveolens]|uniref:uncharacterized protein LOC141660046 n=1 Tax=Apium graveolens TaxID=4045 RepID=UPI003D797ABC